MRVEVTPRRLSAAPGRPAVVTVAVTNTGSLISGHRIRVLGVDPSWTELDQERLSLFPDGTGTAVVTVTLPKGIPAGVRRMDVEVSELTPPGDVAVVTVELTVPAQSDVKLSIDPTSVTGGKAALVGVLVENTGNALFEMPLSGKDEEGAVEFDFTPPEPSLHPGEQVLASARLRAPRPWFGNPKIRRYTVEIGPLQAPVVAQGAWAQRPRLSRGALALTGLLAAATVFAVVLAVTLSSVVSQSDANRDLALQVAAAAANHGTSSGTASIAGTVSELTTGATAPGITVDLFTSANTADPIVSTSTSASGVYRFQGLAAGSYKLRFDGAGFTQLWYPESLSPGGAKVVGVGSGQAVSGVNVYLGGLPATISGQVTGSNVAGALLTLELPGGSASGTSSTSQGASATAATRRATTGPAATLTAAVTARATLASSSSAAASSATPIVVTSQTLGSSGQFSFGDVPSPAVYDLVLTKSGYATVTQEVDLTGGEDRSGVSMQLVEGNGSIGGTVASSTGTALGGATISASTSTAVAGTTSVSGTSTVNTISETTAGHVGDFSLDDLPTPASLTLVVSDPGYSSQTIAVSLTSDQQLTGVHVVLSPGVGSISGTVMAATGSGPGASAAPAGGVTVTATNGTVDLTTVTLSVGKVGTYSFGGLTIPSTYTLTFSRSDLASQSLAVSLPDDGSVSATQDLTMVPATATISGVVSQVCPSGTDIGCTPGPVGGVSVSLVEGSVTYQVTSASQPQPGVYRLDDIQPGTYALSYTRPGGLTTSKALTLSAGEDKTIDETLPAEASIYGYVDIAGSGDTPVKGAEVDLYLADQYPTVLLDSFTTASNGEFYFDDLNAPESYVVTAAYPAGSSPQESVLVATSASRASPACGSDATGNGGAPTSTSGSCTASTDPLRVSTQ